MPTSQSKSNKLYIGITGGDAAGIGPEIILKALSKISARSGPAYGTKAKDISFLIIGDYSVFKRVQKKLTHLNIKTPTLSLINKVRDLHLSKIKINILDLKIIGNRSYKMGMLNKICARASMEYIMKAVDLVKDKVIDTLVTAPVNKESLTQAGYDWPGHTELLAHLTKTKEFAMMFLADNLKVVLVTTHLALREVSRNLKSKDIFRKIKLTQAFLKKYFQIKNPSIGVCGLNPHASDGGLFGKEEKDIILPAVKKARKINIKIRGPESAESLFYEAYHKKIDAVVCMYHDQALIPVKMILRDKAVNLTLGLPFIRTSPSSGTAYDISKRFMASSESMIEAIKLAIYLSRQRLG